MMIKVMMMGLKWMVARCADDLALNQVIHLPSRGALLGADKFN